MAIQTQSETDVVYDIDRKLTFVASQMGSGKSKQLQKLLLDHQYEVVCCLSFRRTFASEFAERFQLVDYQNIKAAFIDNTRYRRVIIQVDSLCKYAD